MSLITRVAGPDELDACFALRREVFVVEQAIDEALEFDGLDPDCVHVLTRDPEGAVVGTARLRIVGTDGKAERVAVAAAARRAGVGRALMDVLEHEARARGLARVVLHAQDVAIPFYDALGYQGIGEMFVEAGIPHLKMARTL